MARHPNLKKLHLIYLAILQYPGIKPAEIAQQLGVSRSEVTRALAALEAHLFLISEDERGGLWPFRHE